MASDDFITAIILSIYYHTGKFGAAYYSEQMATVYLLHDLSEDFEFRMVNSLLRQVSPTVIIVSKTQDISLLTFLSRDGGGDTFSRSDERPESAATNSKNDTTRNINKDHERTREDGEEEGNDSDDDGQISRLCALHLMPEVAYNFEGAKTRIAALFESNSLNAEENAAKLAFRVDVTSTRMVRAFGALLKYLDAVRLGVEFEDYRVKTPIVTVKMFTIEQMLEVDETTLRALSIFQKQPHPSAFVAGTSRCSREGISLFRMCNRCSSRPGKALLRRWFERPTMNTDVLKSRLMAVEFFSADCNLDAVNFVQKRLRSICAPKGILKRAHGGHLSVNDWRNLYLPLRVLVIAYQKLQRNRRPVVVYIRAHFTVMLQTCAGIIEIIEYTTMRNLRFDLLMGDLRGVIDEIVRLAAVITEIVDFDEMSAENSFSVNRGVDHHLDELKDTYAKLPIMLAAVAKDEAKLLDVEMCSVVYMPMLGYLLVLPKEVNISKEAESRVEMIYEVDGIRHVKNARMHALDAEIGDIKMEIHDLETSAMLRLQSMICERRRALLVAVHGCASLDCAISLASAAREYNWCRPQLVTESVIDVDNSRHPISELLSPTRFIANPIRSGGAQSKVKVLSGPNASGKSVYLKQVALIAYMAHIGSFVPAERAIIGPIDRIISRMYTSECVLDGMSTFAKDLAQVGVAVRRGSGNSLVVLDEFGKGTANDVGLSLLAASLNFWIRKGKDSCPHVFVTSHFHSLPDHLIKDPEMLSFHTMEVVSRRDRLEFRYELVDGLIDYSFAAYTAAQFGLPHSVANRAADVGFIDLASKILKRNASQEEGGEQQSNSGEGVYGYESEMVVEGQQDTDKCSGAAKENDRDTTVIDNTVVSESQGLVMDRLLNTSAKEAGISSTTFDSIDSSKPSSILKTHRTNVNCNFIFSLCR
ncbi:unnamed protein product [Toxocara canis]|uniref:DNA_MISMATCH_REPAIR_2 domain-containing protein n=1 Tax=Toxocara canis TaxID=6265 RepID=A0A183US03_TOXCA|nr:unnamed protein product [Toxocara canis]